MSQNILIQLLRKIYIIFGGVFLYIHFIYEDDQRVSQGLPYIMYFSTSHPRQKEHATF